jgi:hypothetical protein
MGQVAQCGITIARHNVKLTSSSAKTYKVGYYKKIK